MDIYFYHIDEFIWTAKMDDDIILFPENMRQKINAYKSIEHKIHDYFGKKMIQYILEKHQSNYTLQDLKYTERGKPFISPDFDFNISHSGNFVVGVFVEQAKVGIDIEKHRNIEVADFKKYFSDKEWEIIQHSTNLQSAFFDFWAIKESAIKCNGEGFLVLSKTETINEKLIQCANEIYYYRLLTINKNYSFAICSNRNIENVNLNEIVV